MLKTQPYSTIVMYEYHHCGYWLKSITPPSFFDEPIDLGANGLANRIDSALVEAAENYRLNPGDDLPRQTVKGIIKVLLILDAIICFPNNSSIIRDYKKALNETFRVTPLARWTWDGQNVVFSAGVPGSSYWNARGDGHPRRYV